METITSRENAKIKYACAVRDSEKQRAADGLFFAEGPKLCLELAKSCTPRAMYATAAALAKTPELAQFDPAEIAPHVAEKLSGTKSNQGVFALFETPVPPADTLDTARRILMLEGVQDPGNVGRVAGIADLHQPHPPREHRQHPVELPAARACVRLHAAAGAVQNPQRVRLHDNADVVVVAAVSGGGVSARQGVSLCARFMRAENEFAAPELPRAAQGIQVVHGVARRPVCAVDAAPLPAAAANRADDQPDAVAVAVRAVAPQSVARISRLNPPYIRQKFVDGHVFTPIQPMRKGGLGCKKKTEQPQKPLRHQFTLDYASTRKA